MAKIEQSALAKSDLVDIWLYIAQDNVNAADRFIDQIERTFVLLASTPEAGVGRDKGRLLNWTTVGQYPFH